MTKNKCVECTDFLDEDGNFWKMSGKYMVDENGKYWEAIRPPICLGKATKQDIQQCLDKRILKGH